MKGMTLYRSLLPLLYPKDPEVAEPCRHFEERIVGGFLAKLRMGIDVPNFPQFRDMSEMFLRLIDGVEKIKEGYRVLGRLRAKSEVSVLPEVEAIKRNISRIRDEMGRRVALKICVTGPYTLFSQLVNRTVEAVEELSEAVRQIVAANIIAHRDLEVTLMSLDEPVFGLISDPLLDRGSSGREALLKGWETVFREAKGRGIRTMMHLHNTADDLFWDTKHLDLIESHVDDPFYRSKVAKQACEKSDKFVKASIAVTDFDRLIREKILSSNKSLDEASLNQMVANAWTSIRRGESDPLLYLELQQVMQGRLRRIVRTFGEDRVLFTGPECGMLSFPTPECALECLRRVSKAARTKR